MFISDSSRNSNKHHHLSIIINIKIMKNLDLFLKFIFTLSIMCVISSCSEDPTPIDDVEEMHVYGAAPQSRSTNEGEATESQKQIAMEKFAIILSKAVYKYKGVRELLKEEALKMFDMNSEVLYVSIENRYVSNKIFRNILLEYTTEAELMQIETTVPLLNILIPEIKMFDVTVANMDCNDKEIPVAIAKDAGMSLYVNGVEEIVIAPGSLPDFHTIVVNENNRVLKAAPESRGGGIEFISPNYDGRNTQISAMSDDLPLDPTVSGGRAIQAYQYFNGYDSDEYSIALQRDFIYYGMTPTSTRGSFNNAVTEYLATFTVNPKAYFNIADQTNGANYSDPSIVKYSVSRKKKKYTEEELISKMWSRGAYNFRFEIFSSNSSQPVVIYIPLRPEELWDFNVQTSYRHETLFRDKKYTYKIDPNKFTAKNVFLKSDKISLGKWDLSKEATERFISIYEEDKSATYSESIEYEMTKMTLAKINGSIKIGLGTDLVSGSVGTEGGSSTTTKITKKYEFTRKEEDDALGTIKVYFYDPIITFRQGDRFFHNEYNTGVVSFVITADNIM